MVRCLGDSISHNTVRYSRTHDTQRGSRSGSRAAHQRLAGRRRLRASGGSGADRARRGGLGLRRRVARPSTALLPSTWSGLSFTASGLRALITTCVEADRIGAEYGPGDHGFAELAAVPWQDPDAFVRAAEQLAGAPASRIAVGRPSRLRHDVTRRPHRAAARAVCARAGGPCRPRAGRGRRAAVRPARLAAGRA